MPRFIPTAASAIAALPAIAPAWAERSPTKMGVLTDLAGPYSIAVEGGKDAERVLRRTRTIPIQDDVVRHAALRPDGCMVHDWCVFEVKQPDESQGGWDLYKLVDAVPGDAAFRPLAAGGYPRLLAP